MPPPTGTGTVTVHQTRPAWQVRHQQHEGTRRLPRRCVHSASHLATHFRGPTYRRERSLSVRQNCHAKIQDAKKTLFLFFGPDRGELAYHVRHMVLETTSRNQRSELSGATMIPQMTVVTDLTRRGRFRTARAQRGHSANYYGDYPGNNPENHPPAESCTINSKLKNSNI